MPRFVELMTVSAASRCVVPATDTRRMTVPTFVDCTHLLVSLAMTANRTDGRQSW